MVMFCDGNDFHYFLDFVPLCQYLFIANEMTNSSEHSYSNITCSVEGSFLNILTFKFKFTEVKETKDYERSNDDKFAHIFVVR